MQDDTWDAAGDPAEQAGAQRCRAVINPPIINRRQYPKEVSHGRTCRMPSPRGRPNLLFKNSRPLMRIRTAQRRRWSSGIRGCGRQPETLGLIDLSSTTYFAVFKILAGLVDRLPQVKSAPILDQRYRAAAAADGMFQCCACWADKA